MSSKYTRDAQGNLVAKQAAFHLPVIEAELGYPGKRELCPKERPCPRLACEFHLWREDEHPGKPHAAKGETEVRRQPVKIKAKPESCTLDVTERHPDGIGYKKIAGLLGADIRRMEQLGTRAVLKLAIKRALDENEDELREKLPAGSIVQTFHHRGESPATVLVTYVIALEDPNHEAPLTSSARAGVTVRKRST